MFTGIIEEVGTVAAIKRRRTNFRIDVKCETIMEDVEPGDSVAVNGACLTVAERMPSGFSADVMPETLRRTTLRELGVRAPVNLERAMLADGRFGGHLVLGHIDGVGVVRSVDREGNARVLSIHADDEVMQYLVSKGSVALDGISLTIAHLESSGFCVSIVPHTHAHTTLCSISKGNTVNIETDLIGKYVSKMVGRGQVGRLDLDIDSLRRKGFG